MVDVAKQWAPVTDKWREIAAEVAAFQAPLLPIDREGKTHEQVMQEVLAGGHNGWVKSWGRARDTWLNYGLVFDGCAAPTTGLPTLAAALAKVPGIYVSALSMLLPGAVICLHSHPEVHNRGCMIHHLGLIVPDGCVVRFGYQFEVERAGHSFWFDGLLPHWSVNAHPTDIRMVLVSEFDPHATFEPADPA